MADQRGRHKFGGYLKRTISFYIDGKPHTWLKDTFVEVFSSLKGDRGFMVGLRVGKIENTFHFANWIEVQGMLQMPVDGGLTDLTPGKPDEPEKPEPDQGKINFL